MSGSKRLASKLLTLPITDHRHVGIKQQLFFFHPVSPGSCFFLPRGAHIYNKLIDYLRIEYMKRGYVEVITPNIYSCQLWETSGHWDHYKDNMIKFPMGQQEYSLKPMNCPGHCIMFKNQETKSSSQLPVRWADFGVLHRNELSGSLLGLSRVRRFQQDDAHIFCTPHQVEQEVSNCLDFAKEIYTKFGFTFSIKLSLRPKKFMGEVSLWDKAEESLRFALDNSNLEWEEQKFEGAFYGPKIDLTVKDVHERANQCATIQLDFQLPQRFELNYYNETDKSRQQPVMIHRAILGSIERFIAMIAENCSGRWPFWLSPIQVQVIPVHACFNDYAKEVARQLKEQGFCVDCDLSTSTFNRKVREATTTHYNLICIVGQRESETDSVTLRLASDSDSTSDGNKPVRNIIVPLKKLVGYLRDSTKRQVDRVDIELLNVLSDMSGNKET